ncbi:MAG: SCO family protein [Myxococcales bacterium]|nr:SCO family protein [Myxococcales bacterium]MCB9705318.1 SCO family protein [Myxococcales bacterium]
MRRLAPLTITAALALGVGAEVRAGDEALAPAMHSIDVEEHLGAVVDKDLTFVDQTGKSVRIGDFLDGKRPVLLTLNYYRCPVLCNVQLNGLTDALHAFDWVPGDEHFRVVTVSIDPREGTEIASAKRDSHLKALDRGDDIGWDFLTGDALNIKLLAAQLGIGYAYDAEQDQYAHPAVVVFLAPDGKIARYVYGLTYETKDLRFGLIEASEGRVGSTVDRIILSCFHYDATIGRYGPFAFGLMRLGGVLTIALLGIALLVFFRREKRRQGARRAVHAEAPT